MDWLILALNTLANGVALTGGAIILGGAIVALYRLGCVEWAAFRKVDVEHDRQSLRHHLGYYILLGLEFIVVADILRTLVHPGREELLTLAAVVLIRTVISVTLNWELSRGEDVEDRHP
ncbi:DUF1622 domain-containing protein [soil metagenome]